MTRVIGLRVSRVSEVRQAEQALPAVSLGRMIGLGLPEGVWVELSAGQGTALARLAIEASVSRLQRAIEQQQSAVLAFEDGDPRKPIILGIVSSPQQADASEAARGLVVEAEADGRRLRLNAQEEIVLQCGDSSISLKRDGRVVIRGAYVETNATNTNRIKGGNVRIN